MTQLAELRREYDVATRVREQMARQRAAEAELSALYETARDLTAIRDLDAILAAIVRRARQLLHADMTYLSLNDELEGASYMKVTDGALTPEFRELRLPLGTGLLGLVAQSGAPYFTEDYQADERFVHRDYIDSAVDGRADPRDPRRAAHRRGQGHRRAARRAPHGPAVPAGEVALLTSFAAHAAVALENARLFEQARAAVRGRRGQRRARPSRRPSAPRTRTTCSPTCCCTAAGSSRSPTCWPRCSAATSRCTTTRGACSPGRGPTDRRLAGRRRRGARSGRCVQTDGGAWVAVAAAGDEHLGTLVLRRDAPLDLPERRTLERGALVTALVLLFGRIEAEAESRVRGELLADLVERARPRPATGCASAPAARAPTSTHDRGRRRRRRRRRGPAPRRSAAARRLGRGCSGLGGATTGSWSCSARRRPARRSGERAALTRLGGATVGVAAGPRRGDGSRSAWREARQCLDDAARLGRTGEVSDPAGLGLARLLLGGNGPEELEEFVDAHARTGLRYDARARHPAGSRPWRRGSGPAGALRETAERLHVHPNTVTQRLDRVSQLLGDGLARPGPGARRPARAADGAAARDM